MKIAVVGPGAMGTLFTLLLSKAGHDLHLLDKDAGRAAALSQK